MVSKMFCASSQIYTAQNEERELLFLYCLVFVMTQIQQTARKLYLYHKDNTYCNSLVTRERQRLNSVVKFDTGSESAAFGLLIYLFNLLIFRIKLIEELKIKVPEVSFICQI